jgi:uncharacterized protein YjbI with pentapeptide repeats
MSSAGMSNAGMSNAGMSNAGMSGAGMSNAGMSGAGMSGAGMSGGGVGGASGTGAAGGWPHGSTGGSASSAGTGGAVTHPEGGAAPLAGGSAGASSQAGRGGRSAEGGAPTAGNGGASTAGTAGTAGVAGTDECAGYAACLRHRYSFDDAGSTVSDSAGAAAGKLVNGSQSLGSARLAGGTSDQYVQLPTGMLSRLSNATLEAWVLWRGGAAWQRIFDFGDNDAQSVGLQGRSGLSYLFLTPQTSSGRLRVAYRSGRGTGEVFVDGSSVFPTGSVTHVAVVVSATASLLSLYMNGAQVGQATLTSPLSAVRDVNDWLGRSQYQADPELAGELHELRIYGSARTSAQLRATYEKGPNVAPSQ